MSFLNDVNDIKRRARLEATRLRSHTGNSTQLVGGRVEGEAHAGSQVQVLHGHPGWSSEAEALQEGAEEDEELHPGQTLPETNPAACGRHHR